jgi:hypothetical protein
VPPALWVRDFDNAQNMTLLAFMADILSGGTTDLEFNIGFFFTTATDKGDNDWNFSCWWLNVES